MPNKILIVDDEPFNLDLLEQELEEQNYTIERANDGAEALEKVSSFLPDLILLDYMMPKMNGLEVLRRLREDAQYKSIPVILLTAKATQEDKVRGLDAGADDYVIKPFDAFELLARVRAMMRIKQMHDTLDEWNRSLTEKVKQQVEELERVNRLKRYCPHKLPKPSWEKMKIFLKVTVVRLLSSFWTCGASPRFRTAPSRKKSWKYYAAIMPRWASLFLILTEPWSVSQAMASWFFLTIRFRAPIIPRKRCAWPWLCKIKVEELRAEWFKKGYELDLGIGMATGYATLGNIGFEGRMDYGAIGNVTNLAARLCSEAKACQILTNQRTLSKIENLVEYESLEELQLKGVSRPVAAFNI